MKKEIEEEISVPEKRIKYISKFKDKFEDKGKVNLQFKHKEELIKIKSEDASLIWIAKKVVEAIIKGFRYKDAEKLFNPNTRYVELDLKDFAGRKRKKLRSIKGRVIGRKGACKKKLQDMTHTKIVVSDKSIGIIGKYEDVELVRKAIERLLSGAKHSTAYRFIRESRI